MQSLRLQSFHQRTPHFYLLISRKLCAFGGEVKDVNGHLSFSIDERDFYVAALLL
jgi:hypothetical protein